MCLWVCVYLMSLVLLLCGVPNFLRGSQVGEAGVGAVLYLDECRVKVGKVFVFW